MAHAFERAIDDLIDRVLVSSPRGTRVERA
jgi:hypothetical protein